MAGVISHHELEYHSQRYAVIIILALSLIVFLGPLILRVADGSPITPGGESYTLLHDADILLSGSSTDTVPFQRSVPSPYAILLAFMALFGVPWLLPPLLAIAVVMISYLLLTATYGQRSMALFAAVALIISPLMSVLATWHAPLLLCSLLVLGAIAIGRFAPAFIAAAILTHPVGGSLAAMAFIAYAAYRKEWVRSAVIAGSSTAIAIVTILLFGTRPFHELVFASWSPDIIFELGMPTGVSVFLLILACYGIMVDFTGRRIAWFSVLIALMLGSMAFPSLLIALTVIIALLVGHAVHRLLVVEWRLSMLQESLLILIGCIALFLVITTMRERLADDPDAALSRTLITLRNTERDGAILTDPQDAPFVRHFSGRKPALETNDHSDIFLSRDAVRAYAFMESSDVAYVVITDAMRDDLLLEGEDGILFLLQHSGRFVPIASPGGASVWYFIQLERDG
ncbi:TPA: hypothetical protein HA251_05530 [Candidatus Woesearchaeota archaeon]|nr:hypothetical protein [Candidatus Woesearchaeota archaeon]